MVLNPTVPYINWKPDPRVSGSLLPGEEDRGGAAAARLHSQEVHGNALPQLLAKANNTPRLPVLCFLLLSQHSGLVCLVQFPDM